MAKKLLVEKFVQQNKTHQKNCFQSKTNTNIEFFVTCNKLSTLEVIPENTLAFSFKHYLQSSYTELREVIIYLPTLRKGDDR